VGLYDIFGNGSNNSYKAAPYGVHARILERKRLRSTVFRAPTFPKQNPAGRPSGSAKNARSSWHGPSRVQSGQSAGSKSNGSSRWQRSCPLIVERTRRATKLPSVRPAGQKHSNSRNFISRSREDKNTPYKRRLKGKRIPEMWPFE
jgi:hypothetical protein